mmetsp:Transcript_2079/g.7600  ORF Transcript_2079/g.7600 Transcript_2079/m.7600 type:complete len:200 (+) Transcript_2079:1264-1863(+)
MLRNGFLRRLEIRVLASFAQLGVQLAPVAENANAVVEGGCRPARRLLRPLRVCIRGELLLVRNRREIFSPEVDAADDGVGRDLLGLLLESLRVGRRRRLRNLRTRRGFRVLRLDDIEPIVNCDGLTQEFATRARRIASTAVMMSPAALGKKRAVGNVRRRGRMVVHPCRNRLRRARQLRAGAIGILGGGVLLDLRLPLF